VDSPAEHPTISVLETPHSIAVSHDGATAYVSHFRSGSVSLIDTATNAVTRVLESGTNAYGVVPTFNDKFLLVAHPDSEFLQTVEVSSGNGFGTGIGAKSYGLGTTGGGRFYATAGLDDAIIVLDVALFETLDELIRNVARIEGVDFPVSIVASPDGSRLYVSNYFAATVSVIDATKVEINVFDQPAVLIDSIPVATGPSGLAVSPDGSRLYVAHFPEGNAISVVDTTSFTVVDTIAVGNGPVRGVAISHDGTKLYAANYFASSISVLAL
jgi:YVTN family beta-propeller protein